MPDRHGRLAPRKASNGNGQKFDDLARGLLPIQLEAPCELILSVPEGDAEAHASAYGVFVVPRPVRGTKWSPVTHLPVTTGEGIFLSFQGLCDWARVVEIAVGGHHRRAIVFEEGFRLQAHTWPFAPFAGLNAVRGVHRWSPAHAPEASLARLSAAWEINDSHFQLDSAWGSTGGPMDGERFREARLIWPVGDAFEDPLAGPILDVPDFHVDAPVRIRGIIADRDHEVPLLAGRLVLDDATPVQMDPTEEAVQRWPPEVQAAWSQALRSRKASGELPNGVRWTRMGGAMYIVSNPTDEACAVHLLVGAEPMSPPRPETRDDDPGRRR